MTTPTPTAAQPAATELLRKVEALRWELPQDMQERLVESIYGQASRIANRHIARDGASFRLIWQERLDRILTSRWTGFPAMFAIFAVVLWLTIEGANVPSAMLSGLLVTKGHALLHSILTAMHLPAWLIGVTVDGMYLTTAWVVSVMLPPMAIFFPLFTLLEDFGYLPRVAFNMDRVFQAVGAHGKQALTMSMGYGCNAAGVIAARIIDSPRERLIAIITNNFALCNGRWPTQILIATIFIGALAPPALAGITASAAVLAVTVLGVVLTLVSSWLLSRTALRGTASTFSLELPPYRPPRFWRTIYTSIIDRTLFVLWRAVIFALPAGVLIWALANIQAGDQSLAVWLIEWLDPAAALFGLTGVILVAYLIAIPANEIVIPTILMLTVLQTGLSEYGQGAGVIFETGHDSLRSLLTAGGWTTLTAVCLMLFSLCHNPCSTTIYTIYKETGSLKWTTLATFLPLAWGAALCALTAFIWRLAS